MEKNSEKELEKKSIFPPNSRKKATEKCILGSCFGFLNLARSSYTKGKNE